MLFRSLAALDKMRADQRVAQSPQPVHQLPELTALPAALDASLPRLANAEPVQKMHDETPLKAIDAAPAKEHTAIK